LAAPTVRDTTAADRSPKPAYALVTDGSVRISARLAPRRTTRRLTVGDRFAVELVVTHHRSIRPSPPFCRGLGDFAVVEQHLTTRYRGDTTVDLYRLTMAGFATGDLKIPPFAAAWQSPAGQLGAESDSVPVTIASVMPADMKDINELKPQAQFPDRVPLLIVAAVLAVAGLGYAGWRLRRRYRRMRLAPTPRPDPWDEALTALGAIPMLDWLDRNWLKKYYYAVSEILKRYLARRFEFPAIDQTTTEIVRAMKLGKVPAKERFAEFFCRADMVKYAKLNPPRPEAEALIDLARELVRATTPRGDAGQAANGKGQGASGGHSP
jgi:hypothetical protein